ncbi:hypothetical protein GCM10011504_02160 [Siccirubricoccus deserti]|nr:hypothetical protein GCM10011504_02160 [Siccirubricoccus deserti]
MRNEGKVPGGGQQVREVHEIDNAAAPMTLRNGAPGSPRPRVAAPDVTGYAAPWMLERDTPRERNR